jgi:calcium channel MID1
MSSLAAFYDNYTQNYYNNFKKVLAQTPCDTTSSSKYSLARSCEDCEIAYKRWLCAVTIPRCTDYSSTKPWLIPRALSQPFPNGTFLPNEGVPPFMRTSRNPLIDQKVIPGPYKEVLPCHDLCYDVVQSCPASMGFQCPLPEDMGFNQSYGVRPEGQQPGVVEKSTQITCNYPGAAYFLAGGGRVNVNLVGLVMAVVLGVGVLVM